MPGVESENVKGDHMFFAIAQLLLPMLNDWKMFVQYAVTRCSYHDQFTYVWV